MAASELISTLILWIAIAVLLMTAGRRGDLPFPWDIALLTRAAACRNRRLDRIFLAVTHLGSFFVLTPMAAALLWRLIQAGRAEAGFFLMLSFIGASAIANLSKPLFKRKRPNLFPILGKMPAHSSFPSAHSAQITAFAGSLFFIFHPAEAPFAGWLAASVLVVAAVAFSRIYLQVHYPSDVIAGLMLALLWVLASRHLLALFGINIE
jgi:undecaprenyl-diphosphatase